MTNPVYIYSFSIAFQINANKPVAEFDAQALRASIISRIVQMPEPELRAAIGEPQLADITIPSQPKPS
jgi:hypothetical protein